MLTRDPRAHVPDLFRVYSPSLCLKRQPARQHWYLVHDCLFPLGYSQLTSISAGRQAIRRPANAPHSGYQPPANDFRGSSLTAWEGTHASNPRQRPLIMRRYRLTLRPRAHVRTNAGTPRVLLATLPFAPLPSLPRPPPEPPPPQR